MSGSWNRRAAGALLHVFRELKRRRVIRVVAAYVGLFFVLTQAASVFFPALHLPEWSVTLLVALGILGLPVVVTLAWVFDVTHDGVVRTPRASPAAAGPGMAGSPDSGWNAGPKPDAALLQARQRWNEVQSIFSDALESQPQDRSAFLEQATRGDTTLLAEVEAMLRAHESHGAVDRLSAGVLAPLLEPLRTPQGTPHAARAERAPPGLNGRYEVLERIGDGGMGIVHRARDVRLQREIALKFLPDALATGPEARRRFITEAQAAAALDHPNICTVHEIGETDDGGLYIAMPLYDGETLDRRLARGALPWEDAVDVAMQVAAGLARAHDAGIVHRDIKPANLCITAQGHAKILDFGIAKVAAADATGVLRVLGTAAYMSPEQARGEEVDHRSDLWSLGVVLYEMLTGERLFRGEDRDAVLAGIRSTAPVPVGRLRSTAPPGIVRVVESMLARSREGRPASASAVAALLRDAVSAARQHGNAGDESTDATLAAEGERRQATVLVLEFVAYARLLEELGPEPLDALLGRARGDIEDVIRSHGGAVNEAGSEHMVVVFGVPVTHEDDAVRAARAAAAVHDMTTTVDGAGEAPLLLRAGVSTGTLVAHADGGPGRRFRLTGEPTSTAAQLAARASGGETLLDEATARLVHERFETSRSGDLQQAGSAAGAVAIHRLGAEQASGPRRQDELPPRLTEYTGRQAELAALVAAFEQARAGDGQLVTVVGEAGAGKSRLLHEFRTCQRDGAVRFVRGHCESYGGSRPYLPFVDALHELFALDARSGAETRQAQLLSVLHDIDPQLDQFAPFYLHLLSLPSGQHPLPHQLQGEQFRTAMRESIAALLTLAAERQPLVLVLEDWHWADEASHEVLRQLASIIPPYPVLVIVSYRPGYGAEWDGALPRTLIQLGPLGVGDAAQMVETMVGAPLGDGVAAALHDRSGGNPFFLEELCHSLQEAGMLRVSDGRGRLEGAAGELHLPTTIQGVIRTRLDRLSPATREVVRSAAVLGREFTYPLLERLGHDRYALERSLDTLKRLGILQQLRVVPERTFRFKHALMQEVAYDTLLQHRRRVLHGQAGRAIEALFASHADEHAGRLAYHYSRADEWHQAVRHGRTAAERERALSEFQDALSTLEAVTGWIAHLPADNERRQLEIETLLRQEELCETLGMRRRQQEILDRLADLVVSASDPRLLIEVGRRRGDVCTLLRRFEEARAELDAALDLARRTGDEAAQSHVLRSLGLTAWHERRTAEALVHAEEALRLDTQRGDSNAIIAGLANKAQILKDLERYDEALACLQHAVELLESTPSSLKLSYVLHNMGNVYRTLGDLDRALEHFRRASELSERSRMPVQWSFHLTAIAHIQLTQGRSEEAVSTYREAVAVARRARYAEGLAQSLRPLGEVLAGIGRQAEALPYLREAAEVFGQLGDPGAETAVWRRTAEVAEAIGDSTALHAWERCRGIAAEVGDAALQVDALEGIARLRRKEPVNGALHARSALTAGLELARSSGDPRREGALLNSLAILDWEQGAYENAAERYAAALEIFRALDDRVHAGLILNSLGVTLRALGRTGESRIRLDQALTMNRASGQRRLEGHTLALLGELCMDAGAVREACEQFTASLEVRRATGDRRGEGWMHCRLARALDREGRSQESRAHLESAQAIAAELGDQDLAAECSVVAT